MASPNRPSSNRSSPYRSQNSPTDSPSSNESSPASSVSRVPPPSNPDSSPATSSPTVSPPSTGLLASESSHSDSDSTSSDASPPRNKVTKTWRVFSDSHISKGSSSILSRSTLRLREAQHQAALRQPIASADDTVEIVNEALEDINAGENRGEECGNLEDNRLNSPSVTVSSPSSLDTSNNDTQPSEASNNLRDNSIHLSSDSQSIFFSDQSDSDDTGNDSDDVNINEAKEDGNVKLYVGCERTVTEAVLDIFLDYANNKETKKSLQDHLSTFVKYLPVPNYMPKTVKMLHAFLNKQSPKSISVNSELYCGNCLLYVNHARARCEACNGDNHKCFYSFQIQDQITFFFESCNLADVLDKYQQQLSSGDNNCIQDICHGVEYIRHKINGKYNLTLMWNTDGVPVSRSSNLSLYPVQAVICEIPPYLRQKFLVVFAMWCDYSKPPMATLLTPFIRLLTDINENGGVKWKHPRDGKVFCSFVTAPLACADAPVRANLQNITSHNGKYACNICEQKAERIPYTVEQLQAIAQNRRVQRMRRFCYKAEPSRLRTHDRMIQQGREAFREGKQEVKGVKGPSPLELLPFIDLSAFVSPEYMHSVCRGVVRQFLVLWLNVPGPWYIGVFISDLDVIMNGLKTPLTVGRRPRPLSTYERWKASEFRSWLLFYSLPVLDTFLPQQYLQHWLLLVTAIFILLKETISSNDLELAEVLLNSFVRDVGVLYRDKDCVYNMHELLHLPLCVKRWGPLWATSAFPFEDLNGLFVKLLHGSKNHAKELSNTLITMFGIHGLQRKIANEIPNAISSIVPLSFFHYSELSENVRLNIFSNGFEPLSSEVFCRIRLGANYFTSKMYRQEKMRNNFTILFHRGGVSEYGEIMFFVAAKIDGSLSNICAVVSIFSIDHTRIFFHNPSRLKVSHIIPVMRNNPEQIIFVPISTIQEAVIPVNNYVCRQPNKVEARNL